MPQPQRLGLLPGQAFSHRHSTVYRGPPIWEPQRDWEGMTAVVVGTGPSFDASQARLLGIARARDCIRVMAINDAVFPCWFADALFAADRKWWIERRNLPTFEGTKIALAESYRDAPRQVMLVSRSGKDGCDLRPGHVCTNSNSGAMGVQVAAQLGAERIVLVGFDMREDGRRRHFFGEYEMPLRTQPAMGKWADRFKAVAEAMPGRIFNASSSSAIDCVPKIELASVI